MESVACRISEISGLILFFASFTVAHNLLESNYIGIQFAQYLGNSRGTNAAIHASAFMDIVGGNTEKRHLFHCGGHGAFLELLFTRDKPAQPFHPSLPDRTPLPFF